MLRLKMMKPLSGNGYLFPLTDKEREHINSVARQNASFYDQFPKDAPNYYVFNLGWFKRLLIALRLRTDCDVNLAPNMEISYGLSKNRGENYENPLATLSTTNDGSDHGLGAWYGCEIEGGEPAVETYNSHFSSDPDDKWRDEYAWFFADHFWYHVHNGDYDTLPEGRHHKTFKFTQFFDGLRRKPKEVKIWENIPICSMPAEGDIPYPTREQWIEMMKIPTSYDGYHCVAEGGKTREDRDALRARRYRQVKINHGILTVIVSVAFGFALVEWFLPILIGLVVALVVTIGICHL